MKEESFTAFEKLKISQSIKNISMDVVEREMNELIKIGNDADKLSPRSRTGNNVVDYFTFTSRLETKGKYNVNFYEFMVNIEEFKKKKFIQTMLTYYKEVKNKNNIKNENIVLKEVYNICISAINIMRPLVCMEIYAKYKPSSVLNFCAGWGGSLVGASALNIPKYIGIEINTRLKEPYEKLTTYVNQKSNTQVQMFFQNALDIDYTKLEYDLVFTSPPYYFIEKYENNVFYESKKDMNDNFYKPLFRKTYDGLKHGGYYIINVCKEVYENILIELLGEAIEMYPYKKSKRQNDYNEIVYVWHKKLKIEN